MNGFKEDIKSQRSLEYSGYETKIIKIWNAANEVINIIYIIIIKEAA